MRSAFSAGRTFIACDPNQGQRIDRSQATNYAAWVDRWQQTSAPGQACRLPVREGEAAARKAFEQFAASHSESGSGDGTSGGGFFTALGRIIGGAVGFILGGPGGAVVAAEMGARAGSTTHWATGTSMRPRPSPASFAARPVRSAWSRLRAATRVPSSRSLCNKTHQYPRGPAASAGL